MGVALSNRGLLLQNKIGKQQLQFIRDLTDALRSPVFIWVPLAGDVLSAVDKSGNDAPITWLTSQPARLGVLGRGLAVSFNASTDAGNTPNAARYSFNLAGLTDLPFSVMAVAKPTSAATERDMFAKWNTAVGREYIFQFNAGGSLVLVLEDHSAAIQVSAASGALTQAQNHLYSATYSGLGGATAMNGVALYQDGAALGGLTLTNNAAYVAMDSSVVLPEIAARNIHTTGFFNGNMAMIALCSVQLSAAEIADIYNLCHDFYGF